ncbi:uncharacterized protein [Lolium perenne]|uniref:uncharacterized protein n=1 Tax=Lolium perenne TaxID=4522 RepID=UPI003A996B51
MCHFPSQWASVERTAVAARRSSPGTGQEGPPLGHGRTERQRGQADHKLWYCFVKVFSVDLASGSDKESLHCALVEECLAVGERRGSKEREEARLFYGCGTSLPGSILHLEKVNEQCRLSYTHALLISYRLLEGHLFVLSRLLGAAFTFLFQFLLDWLFSNNSFIGFVKKEVRAIPAENNGARSRSGGMNIFLASPDGHVVSGGVAGLLVAASLVECAKSSLEWLVKH